MMIGIVVDWYEVVKVFSALVGAVVGAASVYVMVGVYRYLKRRL